MRFLPVSGAQNPPWQSSGCLHYRIPAQPLSRKPVGEGGCGGILPGRGQRPPGVRRQKQPAGDISGGLSVREAGSQGAGGVSADCRQAQHRRGLLHGLPGCLCHFRRGLCHGADCSPESTGCDSQLTFPINPLFCEPSSGTSGGRSFLWGGFLLYWSQRMGAGTMIRNMRLGLAILAAVLICAGRDRKSTRLNSSHRL